MGEDRITVKIDRDLEDLIPGYLKRRQEDISAIRNACDACDFENIRILGHSMKGSGGGYGFDQITEIGKLIEESAKNKDPERIREHTDQLAQYLTRIEVVYE